MWQLCVQKGNKIRLQGTYSANVTQKLPELPPGNVKCARYLQTMRDNKTFHQTPTTQQRKRNNSIFFACTLMSKMYSPASCSYLFPFMSFGQKLVENERK